MTDPLKLLALAQPNGYSIRKDWDGPASPTAAEIDAWLAANATGITVTGQQVLDAEPLYLARQKAWADGKERVRIDGEIDALERRQARSLREHVLGDATAKAKVQMIEDQIVALRASRP